MNYWEIKLYPLQNYYIFNNSNHLNDHKTNSKITSYHKKYKISYHYSYKLKFKAINYYYFQNCIIISLKYHFRNLFCILSNKLLNQK